MLSFLKTNFKIVLFSAVLICLFSNVGYAEKIVLYKGIINSFKLNIRTAPSQRADVLEIVVKGQTVDVISPKGPAGTWLTVVYKGQKGYVRNRTKYIKLFPVIAKKPTLKKQKITQKKPVKKIVPKKRAAQKKVEPLVVKKEIVKKKTIQKKSEISKEVTKKESQKIQEKIQSQELLVQTFTQKELEIIEGLNEIDYALNKARINVKSLSSELSGLEVKINQLNQDKTGLKQAIDLKRDYAGKRLRALYKMNMIGRLDVAGMPTTIFDFFLQQNSMKRIIETDFNVLNQQNADYETLENLEGNLQREMQAKTSLESELTDQIRINKSETLKKELILKDIRHKKRLSLAAVESLKEAQIRLDHQISMLKSGTTSGKTQLTFSNYKGQLKFPVKGKIVSRYGPSRTRDSKAFTFQKGIDIKVERGEPVQSVFKGHVIFAQWLKGYGNLLILDHGENYYTLYAHVEEIFRQKGEAVEKGDVIATAGDTGSIKGMCLHFEVRHHGKPINPMQWFKKGA